MKQILPPLAVCIILLIAYVATGTGETERRSAPHMLDLLKPGQTVYGYSYQHQGWTVSIRHKGEVVEIRKKHPTATGYFEVLKSYPDYVVLRSLIDDSQFAVSAESIKEIHLMRELKAEAE